MVKRKRQVERCVSLMRIAILDNDLRFSDQLYQKISMGFAKRDWALNCHIFSHPQDLLNSNLGTLHAVFLDIDMPEMNGLEVASQIRHATLSTAFALATRLWQPRDELTLYWYL